MNERSSFDLRELENNIRGLRDYELARILQHPEEYVPEAPAIALDEIKKRGGVESILFRDGQEVQEIKETKSGRLREQHVLLMKVVAAFPTVLIMLFFVAMVLSTLETATEKNHLEVDAIPHWAQSCMKIVFPILLLPVLWFVWRIITNQLLKVFPPKS